MTRGTRGETPSTARIPVNCTEEEKARYMWAAKVLETSASDICRKALDRAVRMAERKTERASASAASLEEALRAAGYELGDLDASQRALAEALIRIRLRKKK